MTLYLSTELVIISSRVSLTLFNQDKIMFWRNVTMLAHDRQFFVQNGVNFKQISDTNFR